MNCIYIRYITTFIKKSSWIANVIQLMGLQNDKLGLSILKPGSPRDSQTKLSREIPDVDLHRHYMA